MDSFYLFFFSFLTLKSQCPLTMDFPLMCRSLLLCTSVFQRQTRTCISNSRTTFSASCRSAVSESRLQYGTKASARVHARPTLCCDAYMLFSARQGYLCLLSTAERLYHLFRLAAGDSGKSQEICFQNPVALLRHATAFACSDSHDIIILLSLFLFIFYFFAASLHFNLISLAEQHPHL